MFSPGLKNVQTWLSKHHFPLFKLASIRQNRAEGRWPHRRCLAALQVPTCWSIALRHRAKASCLREIQGSLLRRWRCA